MVGECRDVFTNRALLERHINGTMHENPGRAQPPLPPSVDAYVLNNSYLIQKGYKNK